jgi:transcription elongation factor Elf1
MQKTIEYINLAGEQRALETNGRRRAKPTQRTEKLFICQNCGHETCLRCVRETWQTKTEDGDRVRCCNCKIENSMRYMVKTVVLPDAPQQDQELFKFD